MEEITMATLLKIDSSPMGERSVSRKLTAEFAKTWTKAHPGGTVISRALTTLAIPSTLKLWIGQVVRAGKTFGYTASGAHGLLTGKKATLLIASGGVYEQGSALAALNFVTPYLRAVFGFLGITDVNFIAAGGTQKLMTGEVDPQTFLAPSLEKVHAQASL